MHVCMRHQLLSISHGLKGKKPCYLLKKTHNKQMFNKLLSRFKLGFCVFFHSEIQEIA